MSDRLGQPRASESFVEPYESGVLAVAQALRPSGAPGSNRRGELAVPPDDEVSDWTTTRVGPLVKAVVARFERQGQGKGVRLETVAQQDGDATLDRGRFALAVYGLLEDALWLTPQGGTVEVRYEVQQVNVYLTVSNDASTDETHRDHVDASSRDAIEAQGGELRVSRRRGGGTCFSVVLPVCP
jgi:signal transduction histidine kinase